MSRNLQEIKWGIGGGKMTGSPWRSEKSRFNFIPNPFRGFLVDLSYKVGSDFLGGNENREWS